MENNKMKTRLLIIIGMIMILVVSIIFISLAYNQEIKLATGMMITTDCRSDEIRHNDQCIKLEVPQHIGTLHSGIDSFTSYCEDMHTPPDSGMGLERCIPFEFVDVDELLERIQNNDTEPLIWPSSKMLSWCADRFDYTKHEFFESVKHNVTCDTSVCPESEPPLFSSALNNDDDFIEKGCAKFVDKWAYLTEDNDFTWDFINWESFVKHHYENDPISDPLRNEKCAELFDLVMLSSSDSDLWYELTETNDFRDAKCASIVEDWEHLTEHNVWNIEVSWDNVVEHELYGCNENDVYFSGICMTPEVFEKSQEIGVFEDEFEQTGWDPENKHPVFLGWDVPKICSDDMIKYLHDHSSMFDVDEGYGSPLDGVTGIGVHPDDFVQCENELLDIREERK